MVWTAPRGWVLTNKGSRYSWFFGKVMVNSLVFETLNFMLLFVVHSLISWSSCRRVGGSDHKASITVQSSTYLYIGSLLVVRSLIL